MKPSDPLDPYNKYIDSFHVNRTLHEKLVHIPYEIKQTQKKRSLIKRGYKPILTVATCCFLFLILNYFRPLLPSSNKDSAMSPPKEEQNSLKPSENASTNLDTDNVSIPPTTYQLYLTTKEQPNREEEGTRVTLTTITENPKYSTLLPTKLLRELSTKTVVQYGNANDSNYVITLDKKGQNIVRLTLLPMTQNEHTLIVSPNDIPDYSLKGVTVTKQSTDTLLLPIFNRDEVSPDIITSRAYYDNNDTSTVSYSFGITDGDFVIIYEITDMTPDEIYNSLSRQLSRS